MSRPVTFYRLFDADDQLMYVGVTEDFGARLDHHRITLRFGATKVARWELEEFADRDDALAAEAAAIVHQDPPFNVQLRFSALRCRCDVCMEERAAHCGKPVPEIVAALQRRDARDAEQQARFAEVAS